MILVACLSIFVGVLWFPSGLTLLQLKGNDLEISARSFAKAMCTDTTVISWSPDPATANQQTGLFWDSFLTSLRDLECVPAAIVRSTNKLTVPRLGRYTVAMVLPSLEDTPWARLAAQVFFRGNSRLVVAIVDENITTSDEVRAKLAAECTPWNVKGLAMSTWFLAGIGKWITVLPYPDSERICATRTHTEHPFNGPHDSHRQWVLNDFKGHPMLVSTTPYKPYASVDVDNVTGAVSYSGADFVALQDASRGMNFTLNVTITPDGEWGLDRGNGSWSGVIGAVQRREVNIGCSALNAFPTYPAVVR
jgi:hypothetical protein